MTAEVNSAVAALRSQLDISTKSSSPFNWQQCLWLTLALAQVVHTQTIPETSAHGPFPRSSVAVGTARRTLSVEWRDFCAADPDIALFLLFYRHKAVKEELQWALLQDMWQRRGGGGAH